MIALLDNDSYFIDGCENIGDFLVSYANYIGLDVKVFKILVESGELSTKELVEYINSHCYTNEEINEIYEIGAKFY